jgi:hypothetical protein
MTEGTETKQNCQPRATTNEDLWNIFCKARLQSKAYRAVDDPVVRFAYEQWQRADEQDSAEIKTSNVLAFPPKLMNRRGPK